METLKIRPKDRIKVLIHNPEGDMIFAGEFKGLHGIQQAIEMAYAEAELPENLHELSYDVVNMTTGEQVEAVATWRRGL